MSPMATVLADSPLSPDRAVSGHDQIVRVLGGDILSGRIVPGEKLAPEPELLARFGVSRTALREAIKTLTAKGMLVAKTRVGTKVSDPLAWNFFDPEVLAWRVQQGMDADFRRSLVEIRRALEPAAARLAAERRTPEELASLRACIQAMRDETQDAYAFARADLAFHVAVGTASRNPMMRSLAGVIEAALLEAFTLSPPTAAPLLHKETVDLHARIVDAIETGDGPTAAAAMLATIDAGHARIEAERGG